MTDKSMIDVGIVVAAGGAAQRFGIGRNKLLCDLNGLPLVCHCLLTFLERVPAPNIVLVVPTAADAEFGDALRRCSLDCVRRIPGGSTRQESVWAGINALPEGVEIVAIHDAARPFTTNDLLAECVASARRRGSGVAAHRVTDTIKIAKADGEVVSTPDRTILWAAETPQVFQRRLIESGYGRLKFSGERLTDDAQAVEACGGKVHLVDHDSPNPKITFARDLDAWETLALHGIGSK